MKVPGDEGKGTLLHGQGTSLDRQGISRPPFEKNLQVIVSGILQHLGRNREEVFRLGGPSETPACPSQETQAHSPE